MVQRCICTQTHETIQHRAVRAQCRIKIRQPLLQLQKAQDLTVLHVVTQAILDLLGQLADLAQVAQVEHIRLVEDLKEEARPLVRAEELCRALVELCHHGRFLKADRDDVLVCEDDRERQRIVAVLTAIDGHIRQDHDRVVLDIRMRPLLIVECGAQEVGVNLRQRTHDLQLVRRRIDNVDPCALRERLEGQLLKGTGFHGFIDLQQGRTLLSGLSSPVSATYGNEERTAYICEVRAAKVYRPCSSLPFDNRSQNCRMNCNA